MGGFAQLPRKKLSAANLWPISTKKLKPHLLRALSDEDFSLLKSWIAKRSRKWGLSPTSAKKLTRRIELRRRLNKGSRFSRGFLVAKYRPSEILDALIPDREHLWKPISKRRRGRAISCEEFSFLDNPVPTYQTLIRMAEADCSAIHYRIDFHDEYVMDIGPYLIFGIMREHMAPLTAGGLVSGPTRKVLEVVGLRKFLRMKPFHGVDTDDVWPLPLMQRRKGGTSNPTNLSSEPSTVEIRADEITKKVDLWLRQLAPPRKLTEHGIGKIKSIVTETLDNAERHGRVGGDGEWIVAGFMARRPSRQDGQLVHVCHLSFLNLGRPIAETIAEAPPEIVEQIRRYQNAHRRTGLSPGTLATVFALQDGISRVRQGNGNPTGGTGLMDMVEFANAVGWSSIPGNSPKVAILSGDTYIRFEAPYAQGYGNASDNRRLQWFNPPNDVLEPPDPKHVLSLPRAFPGTLITMRFVLDGSLRVEEGDRDDDD